jgi:hypothetical protein
MAEKTFPAQPTASSLKKELREYLQLLIRDFEDLKTFVAEIAPKESSVSILLSKDDVHDLLTATVEIQETASNIVFEASKIKEKLERLG